MMSLAAVEAHVICYSAAAASFWLLRACIPAMRRATRDVVFLSSSLRGSTGARSSSALFRSVPSFPSKTVDRATAYLCHKTCIEVDAPGRLPALAAVVSNFDLVLIRRQMIVMKIQIDPSTTGCLQLLSTNVNRED